MYSNETRTLTSTVLVNYAVNVVVADFFFLARNNTIKEIKMFAGSSIENLVFASLARSFRDFS